MKTVLLTLVLGFSTAFASGVPDVQEVSSAYPTNYSKFRLRLNGPGSQPTDEVIQMLKEGTLRNAKLICLQDYDNECEILTDMFNILCDYTDSHYSVESKAYFAACTGTIVITKRRK